MTFTVLSARPMPCTWMAAATLSMPRVLRCFTCTIHEFGHTSSQLIALALAIKRFVGTQSLQTGLCAYQHMASMCGMPSLPLMHC